MFRLIKNTNEQIEVLKTSEDEDKLLDSLQNYVVNHASNGDEYSMCDLDNVRENRQEHIGNYIVSVDEVSTLTDEEIINHGGGVCAVCHSDDTKPSMPLMNEGYITRSLCCNVCGSTTDEFYSLSGQI